MEHIRTPKVTTLCLKPSSFWASPLSLRSLCPCVYPFIWWHTRSVFLRALPPSMSPSHLSATVSTHSFTQHKWDTSELAPRCYYGPACTNTSPADFLLAVTLLVESPWTLNLVCAKAVWLPYREQAEWGWQPASDNRPSHRAWLLINTPAHVAVMMLTRSSLLPPQAFGYYFIYYGMLIFIIQTRYFTLAHLPNHDVALCW